MSTGQKCRCGTVLPATWPHADQEGNGACLDCLGSEAKATWPDGTARVYVAGSLHRVEPSHASPGLLVLDISRPTGGAYGHEGKRWKAAEKWWGLDSDRFRDGQQPYRSLAHRHYRSAFGGVEPPETPDQREA